jgi:hypothetical protein
MAGIVGVGIKQDLNTKTFSDAPLPIAGTDTAITDFSIKSTNDCHKPAGTNIPDNSLHQWKVKTAVAKMKTGTFDAHGVMTERPIIGDINESQLLLLVPTEGERQINMNMVASGKEQFGDGRLNTAASIRNGFAGFTEDRIIRVPWLDKEVNTIKVGGDDPSAAGLIRSALIVYPPAIATFHHLPYNVQAAKAEGHGIYEISAAAHYGITRYTESGVFVINFKSDI